MIGIRFFINRFKPYNQYSGNAEEICRQIINDCWNGRYFQTSTRNFAEFWTRDFSYCTESLIALGYRDKVIKTLGYALTQFKKYNTITTTISSKGIPTDIFSFSPDSLPLLLRSLRLAKAKDVVEEYKDFIQQKIREYENHCINKNTGLIREGYFSSIKDHAIRHSSCYDNCMAQMLIIECDHWKLLCTITSVDMYKTYFNGYYFFEDLDKKKRVCGDAQVFPFWCNLITNNKTFNSCKRALINEQLSTPFPLRYTKTRSFPHLFFPWIFAPNYEGNTIWMHLGLCYLEVLKNHDKELWKNAMQKITLLIEKNRNFHEVFNPDQTPYQSFFYTSDEGMLWASMYLNMHILSS